VGKGWSYQELHLTGSMGSTPIRLKAPRRRRPSLANDALLPGEARGRAATCRRQLAAGEPGGHPDGLVGVAAFFRMG
jgi:hypothetical protein